MVGDESWVDAMVVVALPWHQRMVQKLEPLLETILGMVVGMEVEEQIRLEMVVQEHSIQVVANNGLLEAVEEEVIGMSFRARLRSFWISSGRSSSWSTPLLLVTPDNSRFGIHVPILHILNPRGMNYNPMFDIGHV